MLDAATLLLDDLETAIIGEPCQPDQVRVTAGEPAEPNPGCTDIAVWVAQMVDDAAFETGCLVRSRLTLAYRVGWCYQENPDGPTTADEAAASECLYGLMEAIWCYLVENRATVAGAAECDRVTLEPFTVQPRGGGWVSAIGQITVDYECVASS